ncbi:MAG: hypothetical protein ABI204_10575 [Ginsengibacter sp.]
MKRILTYCILAAFVLLSACRKSDNPNIPKLTAVSVPLITIDGSVDVTISKDDPLAFKGKFIVDEYFKNGPKPAKYDVVVIKNDNKDNVKHIKDGITTFPTSVDVTGQQLTTLFNAPIVLGDKFTIGVDVTTEAGQLFEGFPKLADAEAYGSGLNGQAGASTTISYSAVCPIYIEDFLGDATVVDNFFWGSTYPVTVTNPSPGVLQVTGVNEQPGVSVLIYLDTKYYTAKVPAEIIDKDVSGYVGPYTNLKMDGKGSVDACKLSINLSIAWTVDQGGFGTGPWILKK